jgi:hypothetical protein
MLILGLIVSPQFVLAQQKAPKAGAIVKSAESADQSTWRVAYVARLDESFDDNPFLLSDARKAALTAAPAPSLPGSRYATMLDGSDWITALRGSVAAEGAGLFGRRTFLEFDAKYEYYHRNASRRNVDFRLSAMQSLGRGAQLGVRGHMLPSFYFRNFMSDAVDLNGDGIIQPNERVYSGATYADNEFAVEYRQRLVRSTPDHPFGARLVVLGGHDSRQYRAPFETRSYGGPFASATVGVALTSALSMDLGYRRATLASTPGLAVLVLNEPDFNVDFNGNGRVTDLSVRTVQMVDFSRVEQTLTTRLRAELSDNVETELSFARRNRSFGSKQPYDVYNDTRRDHRDRLGMNVSFRMTPQVRLKVGVLSESQQHSNSLRAAVPIDGVTAYTRKTLIFSLAYQL